MPTTISGNTGVSQVQAGSITASDLDGAQTGSAPIYGCRAWVNFDGTRDSTGAASTANTARFIRASGNVTSVLRNAAGDYTVTFTTAMPDVNYGKQVTIGDASQTNWQTDRSSSSTTTSFNINTFARNDGALRDVATVSVAIFR